MPRSLDKIWAHFTRITNPKEKHASAVCKHCKRKIKNGLAFRLRNHLKGCDKAPDDVVRKFSPKKKKEKKSMNSYIDDYFTAICKENIRENVTRNVTEKAAETEATQDILEHYFSLMIYSTGVAFRFVDDPFVKQFFELACPNFRLPNRKKIADSLLKKAYNKCKNIVVSKLKSEENITLVSDGWCDRNTKHIVNFMVTTPTMSPIFWSSINTSQIKNTGCAVSKYLKNAIDDIENATGRKKQVCALVTDNASNMKLGSKLLLKEYPHIIYNGCSAHLINLLMADVIKNSFFTAILDNAKTISIYIRSSYYIISRFNVLQNRCKKEMNLSSLCIPVATRWYTNLRCLKSLFENRCIIQPLIQSLENDLEYTRTEKYYSIKKIVNNCTFWDQLSIGVRLLQPIDTCLGVCEKNSSNLSTIYSQFEILANSHVYVENLVPINHPEYEVIANLQKFIIFCIQNRREASITPSIRAACFLDPSINPNIFRFDHCIDEAKLAMRDIINLACKEINDAEEMKKFSRNFQIELERWHSSRIDQNIYLDTYNHNSNPSNYWKFERCYNLIKPVARRLFCSAASSASSERSWSIHEFIQNKRRNRLSESNVRMLVFVYSNLKILLKDDCKLLDYIHDDLDPNTFSNSDIYLDQSSSDGENIEDVVHSSNDQNVPLFVNADSPPDVTGEDAKVNDYSSDEQNVALSAYVDPLPNITQLHVTRSEQENKRIDRTSIRRNTVSRSSHINLEVSSSERNHCKAKRQLLFQYEQES